MNERCNAVELDLAGFAADELDAAAAEAVARHVAGCAACRAELARECLLRETLAGLPTVPAPRALGLRSASPVAPRRRWRGYLAAAGVAAAVVVALLALPRGGPVAPPPDFTAAEVAAARRDAVYGLALAAHIIERTEKNAVVDVFGRRLPQAVTESLRGSPPNPEGGRG